MNERLTRKATKAIPLWERPTWVYRAYDKWGDLLYVGITDYLPARLDRGHRLTAQWYLDLATWIVELYETRHLAFAVESWAIRYEEPRWNLERQPHHVPFILPLPIERSRRHVTRTEGVFD